MSSLLDGLLLDPYRDPRDVYIALRADGQRGSGTIEDPYDGGVRQEPPIAVSTLTFDKKEVIVFHPSHGYTNPQSVVISGVAAAASPFNGTFSATVLNANELKIVLTTEPSAPPAWNDKIYIRKSTELEKDKKEARLYWPVTAVTTAQNHGYVSYDAVIIAGATDTKFNGTFIGVGVTANSFRCILPPMPSLPDGAAGSNATSSKVIPLFDEVMRSVPANSIIRLGPGTFETRGLSSAYAYDANPALVTVGYQVKTGQNLVGAGMDVTVLKLVYAIDKLTVTAAFSSFVEIMGFEASDFTVDCNLAGQPGQYGATFPPVVCAAANALGGQHIRLRRIRVINFGTQSIPECFVLGTSGFYGNPEGAVDNVIADCIVEKPSENNFHGTTSIISSGPDGIRSSNRSGVVRNCYASFEYSNGFLAGPLRVASIQRVAGDGNTLAILTTCEPHRHIAGKALVVRGARATGSPTYGSDLNNPFNGVFAIESIDSDTVLRYRMYRDPEVSAADASLATIGNTHSSEEIAVSALAAYTGDVPPVPERFIATTRRPHNRPPNHIVQLRANQKPDTPLGTPNPFYGPFKVVRVQSTAGADPLFPDLHPNQLILDVPGGSKTLPGGTTPLDWFSSDLSAIGADFHGPEAVAGSGCVTEGNAVFDCSNCFYTDTGTTWSAILRDNYFFNIGRGVNHDFNPDSGGIDTLREASSLTSAGLIATLVTIVTNPPYEHRLSVGQLVAVAGAFAGGTFDNAYNGTFKVGSVPSTTSFTYEMKAMPPGGSVTGPPQFAARWQTLHLVVENNIFDGYALNAESSFALLGIGTNGLQGLDVPPYVFPQLVMRGNIFKHADPSLNAALNYRSDYAKACRLVGVENAIIEGNAVNLEQANVIQYLSGKSVQAANNISFSGKPLPPFEDVGYGQFASRDSLENKIEDALMFSLL